VLGHEAGLLLEDEDLRPCRGEPRGAHADHAPGVSWRTETGGGEIGGEGMSQQVQDVERVVGMDDLVEEVCWHLLSGSRLGRIAFILGDEPWVLPINFGMRDRALVFRTAAGSMLHSLADGAPVAMEVDNVDQAAQTGWSVIARGTLHEITDSQQTATFSDGTVQPWAPGTKDRWMCVVPHAISGRAISRRLPSWRLPYTPEPPPPPQPPG
jgi:nitroimidazol reductase NimA-like FMN-containing flavoprotein (pyridoxamine 5'-phosphate oxidase superfamily)